MLLCRAAVLPCCRAAAGLSSTSLFLTLMLRQCCRARRSSSRSCSASWCSPSPPPCSSSSASHSGLRPPAASLSGALRRPHSGLRYPPATVWREMLSRPLQPVAACCSLLQPGAPLVMCASLRPCPEQPCSSQARGLVPCLVPCMGRVYGSLWGLVASHRPAMAGAGADEGAIGDGRRGYW